MQLPPGTRLLTAYRKHWAHRFGVSPFLPMTRAEMAARGWTVTENVPLSFELAQAQSWAKK